jgi:ABC-type multidrug transport system fused ATPase/permease subunit
MPSEPWLIDATLKENILMNNPYIEAKFSEALKLSFLEKDIDLVDTMFQTKLTDVHMSSDPLFKLKVACARAIYAE